MISKSKVKIKIKENKSFMFTRSIAFSIICFFQVFSINCSSLDEIDFRLKRNGAVWVDGDTIRIKSRGKALKTLPYDNQEQSAEDDAKKNAVSGLLKIFNMNDDLSELSEKEYLNTNPTDYSLKIEIIEAVRNGDVIDKNYNRLSGKVEMLYEVKSPDLREKVAAVK